MSKQQQRHQFGSNYMRNAGIQHSKNGREEEAKLGNGGRSRQKSGGSAVVGALVGGAVGGALGGPPGAILGAVLGAVFSK
jgi:hypothetical protein